MNNYWANDYKLIKNLQERAKKFTLDNWGKFMGTDQTLVAKVYCAMLVGASVNEAYRLEQEMAVETDGLSSVVTVEGILSEITQCNKTNKPKLVQENGWKSDGSSPDESYFERNKQ